MHVNEIVARVKSHWQLKGVLSLVFTVACCVLYLSLQRHPMFPVVEAKAIWLDGLIPFVPDSIYLYETLSLLTPIAPWLMRSRDELNRYCKGLLIIMAIGFGTFFVFPTCSPRPHDILNVNRLYATLIGYDNELNAFPSLHVAFSVFSAACCHWVFDARSRERRFLWFIWVWVLGIVASTLLTKQHVVVDVAAGIVLAVGGYACACRQSGLAKNVRGRHEDRE